MLQKLLSGNHPVLVALRHQIPDVSVKTRKRTGAGFFTEFSIPETVRPAALPTGKTQFGDVEAMIGGLKNGAGFLLYVEQGMLHMLEGYSYEESWPEQIDEFSLRYSDPERKAVLAKLG